MYDTADLTFTNIATALGLGYVIYRAITLQNHPLLNSESKPLPSHKWRLITASFYMPLVPSLAINIPLLFKVFLTVMIYLGVNEFIQIVFLTRHRAEGTQPQIPFLRMTKYIQITGILMSISAYSGDYRIFGTATYISFIFIVSYFMYHFSTLGFKDNYFEALGTLCILLLCLFWVFWSLSHGILLVDMPYGGGYLTVILGVSWIGDASAYYVGSVYGKHKVAVISPSKSWEGIIAEIFFALSLTSALWYLQSTGVSWLPAIAYHHYFVIGLMVGILGVVGDMFESLVKRAGHAKDSGIFFPGHGGVLDRFDGFLFITPAAYYYILFVINKDFGHLNQ